MPRIKILLSDVWITSLFMQVCLNLATFKLNWAGPWFH